MNKYQINYCYNCGRKLRKYQNDLPNFCTNCGIAIKNVNLPKCAICHKDILKVSLILKCSYCEMNFHYACMEKWLKTNNTCPVCLNSYLSPQLSS